MHNPASAAIGARPRLTLERWFATLGTPPVHDLSRSGAAALSLRQLLDWCGVSADELLGQSLDYGPGAGEPRLLEAVRGHLGCAGDTGVVISSGAVEALLLLCLASRPGEVLVGSPAYDGLVAAPTAAGRRVRLVPVWEPRAGHDLGPLAAQITDDTALVVINTPHNPSGAVAGADQIDRLASVCARHGARLVVDEVARGALDAEAVSAATTMGFAAGTTLVIGDVSKSLGLGGLRIGWVAGNAGVCAAAAAAKDGTTVASAVLSERLAAMALENAAPLLQVVRDATTANLAALTAAVDGHVSAETWRPQDGLVCFPGLAPARGMTALLEELRERAVSVVPGTFFGHPGRVRVGLGSPPPLFAEAMAIFAAALRRG